MDASPIEKRYMEGTEGNNVAPSRPVITGAKRAVVTIFFAFCLGMQANARRS